MAEDRTAESTAVSFLEERHKAAYKCIAETRKYLLLSKSIPINLRRPARYFGMVGSLKKKKKKVYAALPWSSNAPGFRVQQPDMPEAVTITCPGFKVYYDIVSQSSGCTTWLRVTLFALCCAHWYFLLKRFLIMKYCR